MTNLRQAAQQALEALLLPTMKTQQMLIQRDEAIIALRRALEQPEQEPVAWIQPGLRDWLCVSYEKDDVHTVPVYPHPPQQQAETAAMRMPKVGDKVICIEDESLGEVVSLTAGGSPDITFDDGSHGTYLLREFAELFGYAEQRQWVGLTGLEQKAIMAMNSRNAVFETEAKLKEKNHG